MATGLGFFVSAGRLARSANAAVQTVIAAVALAATAAAWWRFGAAWGILVLLAAACLLFAATGMQTHRRLDEALERVAKAAEPATFVTQTLVFGGVHHHGGGGGASGPSLSSDPPPSAAGGSVGQDGAGAGS